MKIQVLVATMHQTDHSLLDKMNIQTDAIIGNQCGRDEIENFTWRGHNIRYFSFAERGVGLNRNNALMRADADICVFADDDMVFDDGYAATLERVFGENPDADVILFNLHERIVTQPVVLRKTNVSYFNYLRYGMARVAIRLRRVKENGIYFNQCFGGGTEHCHGEDSLFLNACLNKGLKMVAVPEYLATLSDDRASTWNEGYTEQYISDQGVLYRTMSRRWWKLLCLQDALRRHRSYGRTFFRTYQMMISAGKKMDGK